MENLLCAIISLAMRWLEPRHNTQIQFLREQIQILRSRVVAERIVPTPAEHAELLRIGALLDHDVAELMHIVRPATYQRWRREQRRGYVPKRTRATARTGQRTERSRLSWIKQ